MRRVSKKSAREAAKELDVVLGNYGWSEKILTAHIRKAIDRILADKQPTLSKQTYGIVGFEGDPKDIRRAALDPDGGEAD